MTLQEWMLFMVIWLAASVPLGPNALNCIATTAAHGIATGRWSVVGVFIAACIHMTLAVTGLAAFMTAHPALFELIRWLGVGYLMWMGIAMLRNAQTLQLEAPIAKPTPRRLIGNAIMISLSNPKAIFAWLAIFSQFIDAGAPLGGQLLILAPSALAINLLVYGTYSVLGRGAARLFAGHRKVWFDRLTGTTYLAFAVGLATTQLKRG